MNDRTIEHVLKSLKNKRILVTGHTGFKGSWMCSLLLTIGADVTGYALPAEDGSLFSLLGLSKKVRSVNADIRDAEMVLETVRACRPEIVIHMAAQPIVRASYEDPAGTYATNVMGTVNLCEAIRLTDSVRSFVNVTTDKVYLNHEWAWGYREIDPLDGYDPYSNSKSCSDLITHCYEQSFFSSAGVAVSRMRAGNVIGGGDFAKDRIIPDCVRAAMSQSKILLRNPYSVRPYQHVLEPVTAYLMVAARQYEDHSLGGAYNIGPDESDCVSTGKLADLFCNAWGDGLIWEATDAGGPHEASFLKLDSSLLRSVFGWKPVWSIEQAVFRTAEWYRLFSENRNDRSAGQILSECMAEQTDAYLKDYSAGSLQ